jgi:tetratricopeptide (TPR) repeat protein
MLKEILDQAATELPMRLTNNLDAQQHLQFTLSRVYKDIGAISKAEETASRALALAKKIGGDHDPEVGAVLIALADILMEDGRVQEAEALSLQAAR